MKKILYYALIVSLFFIVSCKNSPSKIPIGKWEYKLLVNKAEIGSAVISNKIENNNYINETNMTMNAGTIKNTSKQIITETTSFKPIKFELYNKILNRDKTQNIDTIANFNGNEVELIAGKLKSKLHINKSFHLPGNYFMSELIKKDFEKDTEIETYIYEPTIEADAPLHTRIKVLGEKKIKINDKEETLIHIIQVIDRLKRVDYYLDKSGIAKKIIIIMLNSRMEMVIR